MELREWAGIILHSPSLSAKLLRPELLTDQRPGGSVSVPRMPAREAGMSWESPLGRGWAKVAFPKVAQMDRDDQRGTVLHFFANHELLALELMALALLRFPDAPPAFRRGLAGVMQEEQSHLERYVARMQQLGVEFGAVPVNSYFWDVMAPTPSPLVFVTQMALTFEQANLDFAQHFLQAFKLVGDEPSAALMDLVYREELGHVGHGLLWFNRWRKPGPSDWQAYKRILPLPLTPARAKGPEMQAAARLELGFSEEFVRELGVYRHSKGRPPRIFLFNPGVEDELAAIGESRTDISAVSSYTVPKVMRDWVHDLASIMQFLACDEDVVLCDHRPTTPCLEQLLRCGYRVPQFVTPSERAELQGRLFERCQPWGQSPIATAEAQALGASWQHPPASAPRAVYAKTWAKALAARLGLDPIGGGSCSSLEEVNDAVRAITLAGGDAVLKAPLGCSGRQMQRVRSGVELSSNQLNWARQILTKQGALVIEPWVHRLADYSVQIEVQDQNTTVLGITRFMTDQRGAYLGHVLGQKHAGLAAEVIRAYHELGVPEVLTQTGVAVGQALSEAGYRGPAGIDAFLYTDGAAIKLRPLVEVNPRYTMGRIALELDRRVQSKANAVWRHWTLSQIRAEGFADFVSFYQSQVERSPLVLKRGLIASGVLATNDPAQAKAVLSLITA